MTRSSLDPRPFLTSLHSSHGPQPTTSISGSCLDMYPTTTTSDSSIGYSAHGARFLDEETEWADPLMFQNLQFGGNLSGSAFAAAGDRCSEISYATESGLSAPVPLPWEGDSSYGELHTGSQADVSILTALSACFLTTARWQVSSTYSQELASSPLCPHWIWTPR